MLVLASTDCVLTIIKKRALSGVAKKLLCTHIKIAVTKCLTAFHEGVAEHEAKHMLHQLDCHNVGNEMVCCFKTYEKNLNMNNRKKYVEERTCYYLLPRHIGCYDTANEVIPSLLKVLKHSQPQCIRFFAPAKNSYSLHRNHSKWEFGARFFQLPEVCADNGTLVLLCWGTLS